MTDDEIRRFREARQVLHDAAEKTMTSIEHLDRAFVAGVREGVLEGRGESRHSRTVGELMALRSRLAILVRNLIEER